MNKNISIWRGSDTPPTLSHIWVKDGSFYIYINEEWKPITDPELLTKIEKLITDSIQEQSKELKNYVDTSVKNITNIKNIDLSDINTLTNIYNNINELLIYQIINYNSKNNYPVVESSYLKNHTLCYFEKNDTLGHSLLSVIEFNTKYYHLLFKNSTTSSSFYYSFAITDNTEDIIQKYPCISADQLWRFIGTPECFILLSKSGGFLKFASRNLYCTSVKNKESASFLKLVSKSNTDLFYIIDIDSSLSLNPLGGSGINRKVGVWDTDEGSAIKIVDFSNNYYKSNDLTSYLYDIKFINSNQYLCSNNDNNIIMSPSPGNKWKFIPNDNKIYIMNEYGGYLTVNNNSLILSETDKTEFSVNIIISNTEDVFYQIAYDDSNGIDVNKEINNISIYSLVRGGFTVNTKCILLLEEYNDILKCSPINELNPLYYRIPQPTATATLELL